MNNIYISLSYICYWYYKKETKQKINYIYAENIIINNIKHKNDSISFISKYKKKWN